MTSPLLALFTRSVRGDTRAKSTYWARAGLTAFMVVVMVMGAFAQLAGGAPGLTFLKAAMWLQTIFLTIVGLGYFASAITEEKEDETLGLLRMTNLSSLSILLGKGTSRLGGALLLLVAQLPFTLLAVTLGGVSPGQVFAAYATLGAYAFLLANLALLASVIAPRTGLAALFTAVVLWGLGGPVEEILGMDGLSPFNRFEEIFTTGFQAPPIDRQVIGSVGVGLLFFLLAWALFDRFSAGPSERTVGGVLSMRKRFRGWFTSGRPLAYNALEWKDFHFLHGGHAGQLAKAIAAGVLVLGTLGVGISNGGELTDPSFPLQIAAWSALWLIGEAGFAASRVCACEVRERTLSSLALLPQDLPFTMTAKVSACWRALTPSATLLALSLLTAFLVSIPRMADELLGIMIALGFSGAYILTLSYLGVHLAAYFSLRMKRGALPLAIVICLASSIFLMIPLFGWFGVPIAAFLVGRDLKRKILLRLNELAAEG